jgi:hypothetical protein
MSHMTDSAYWHEYILEMYAALSVINKDVNSLGVTESDIYRLYKDDLLSYLQFFILLEQSPDSVSDEDRTAKILNMLPLLEYFKECDPEDEEGSLEIINDIVDNELKRLIYLMRHISENFASCSNRFVQLIMEFEMDPENYLSEDELRELYISSAKTYAMEALQDGICIERFHELVSYFEYCKECPISGDDLCTANDALQRLSKRIELKQASLN